MVRDVDAEDLSRHSDLRRGETYTARRDAHGRNEIGAELNHDRVGGRQANRQPTAPGLAPGSHRAPDRPAESAASGSQLVVLDQSHAGLDAQLGRHLGESSLERLDIG